MEIGFCSQIQTEAHDFCSSHHGTDTEKQWFEGRVLVSMQFLEECCLAASPRGDQDG